MLFYLLLLLFFFLLGNSPKSEMTKSHLPIFELIPYFYSWPSSAFYFGLRINVEKIRNAYRYLVDNLCDQDLSFLNSFIAVFWREISSKDAIE